MYRRPLLTLALALLLGAVSRPSAALDLFVIAHPGTRVQAEDLRDVYLGNRQFSGRVKLAPVDNAEIQDAFLARILKLDAARYSNLWIKKNFREGINLPAVKANDGETIEFVRRTPGAVGYVSVLPSGVDLIGKY